MCPWKKSMLHIVKLSSPAPQYTATLATRTGNLENAWAIANIFSFNALIIWLYWPNTEPWLDRVHIVSAGFILVGLFCHILLNIKKPHPFVGCTKGQTESKQRRKWDHKQASKVQIFAGGLHCGVSENQNLESSLRGNTVTLETRKNTREKRTKKHRKHPV